MINTVMWVASNASPLISQRKVTAADVRNGKVTFHATWDEAKAAQISKAEQRLEKAAIDLQNALEEGLSAAKAIDKAEALTKPKTA